MSEPGRPRPRRALGRLLLALGSAALVTCAGEGAARLAGLAPYRRPPQMIEAVRPGPLLVPDPLRGYANAPGPATWEVRYAAGLTWRATHRSDGDRATRPLAVEASYRGRPRLALYGCSYTYGWSVDDEQTFPWQLQRRLPEVDVRNEAVAGYGTVQALLRLRADLADPDAAPAVAVLVHTSLHEERNTLTGRFKKSIVSYDDQTRGLRAPFVRDARSLAVRYAPLGYVPSALARRSALANALEDARDRWERDRLPSAEVTRALLRELAALCARRGVHLLVAGIWNDPATVAALEDLRARGVATVDIALDLSDPRNTLQPVDWHPSPAAHRIYAERLLTALRAQGFVAQ